MPEVSVYSLEQFCEELEHLIPQRKGQSALFEEAQTLLKKLLPNQEFICDVMEKMVSDNAFLLERISTIDRNDIMLYLSPKGSFSIRLFVWWPAVSQHIHDHGSWGIAGGYINRTQEIKYRRLDDSSIEGYAKLEETARRMLNPGDVTYVLPFDIHHMSSSDDKASLTIHIYGEALRKSFVQCFNLQENSIYHLINPKLEKRLLAVRALGAIGGNKAKTHIEKAFHDSHPMVRWESILAMEQVDKDSYMALLKRALIDASEEVKSKAQAILSQQEG